MIMELVMGGRRRTMLLARPSASACTKHAMEHGNDHVSSSANPILLCLPLRTNISPRPPVNGIGGCLWLG